MYKISIRLKQTTLYVKDFDVDTQQLELGNSPYSAGRFNSDELMELEKYVDRTFGVEVDWTGELDD